LTNARTSRMGGRLRWAGLFGLIAVLSLSLTPGVAGAQKGKKKKDTVKVLSYNLYLGSDLANAVNAGLASRTDTFADEVGEVLRDVNLNDFNLRAMRIAADIKKKKVDVVGLQEAALWKIEIPTDGGGPPRGTPALVPQIDYIDTLLNELNKKARTKRQCANAAEKRKAQGKKPKPCYRGYKLVIAQQEADVEQLGDFDNDPGPNGKTFDVSTTDSAEDFARWLDGNDDPPGVNIGEPPSPPFPTDANFDTSPTGTVPDPGGGTDCPDTNPAAGPAFGDTTPGGPWPFAGYDGDIDPATPGSQMPVCLFHGIDGDLRLQMRDVIIARKGAGVKARNVTGGNFSPASTFSLTVFGTPVNFTRGWTAADMTVRGKKFHLVNTHLESESVGTIREDQASELVAPGGPATAPNTVLIGDLNSDPTRAPTNLPDGDGGSNIAINRLFAAGFQPVQPPGFSGGHGTAQQDVLNDLSNLLDNGRIDHILTNSPSIRFRSGTILDGQIAGLWASDHGGVFSRLKVPGGKK
jgi:endonuclease/exonuclease/phosphatase family metal-dependent hydrolase